MSSTETMAAPVSFAESARLMLRERVIDAVGELLRDRGWAEVTMADVADVAGVSRQTLYNSFGSRPELAQAYVLREADGLLGGVDVAVRANAEAPRRALEKALALFLETAPSHPLVRAITREDGNDELLALVTTRGGPLVGQVAARLAATIAETWPSVKRTDAALVSDVLVRLAISHAALPSGKPDDTARDIVRLLGPSIDELL